MDLGIAGKTALVFGGSRGIGRACSIEFAQEKCKVALVARSQGPIDEAVQLAKQRTPDVIGISADCVTKAGIAKAVSLTTQAFGPPDILIFNIDDGAKGTWWDMDDETLYETNQNNVMAFVWAVHAVMGPMQEKRWGRIITIGSNSVKTPNTIIPRFGQNVYRTAAIGLCKTLAYELGNYGITVNTMGTGGFNTDQYRAMRANQAPSQVAAAPAARAPGPARRVGEPEDMAGPVAFIASTRAWYINGTVILVDGGSNGALM